MEICKKTYSDTLNFRPMQSWPQALPRFSWDKVLFTGFQWQNHPTVDLKNLGESAERAFKACYPNLSASELARLIPLWSQIFGEYQVSELMALYQFRWSADLQETFAEIASLPISFQNWISEKSVGPRDLNILRTWKSKIQREKICESILSLNFSKSSGVKILELAGELSLMDHNIEDLLPRKSESADLWLRRMHDLRYPMTAAKDLSAMQKLKQIPWPAHVKTQWLRQGDEAAVNLQMRFSSAEEFKKKLNGLEFVSKYLEEDESRKWNN